MKFNFDFDMWTEPEWVRDHGRGTITVKDASISHNLLPMNDEGSLRIEFYDTAFNLNDYDVEIDSDSDLGKATEILLNKFKNFFKQELSNILAWRMAKTVEDLMNRNLIKEGKGLEIEKLSARLNTTLTGDPMIVNDVIAFPFDGSFISS
jgi:hypothetical protein